MEHEGRSIYWRKRIYLTWEKTTRNCRAKTKRKINPGAVEPETRTFIESIINRKNLYDGGVVELAKNLSNQGKSLNEILKAIQKQFPDLPGGKKGKPSDKTGVQNILKKELSSEVYNQRHGPKRFTQETIDKYLKIRNTMTTAQIQEELDISPSKQQKIDKEYGLGRRKQIVTDRKYSPEDIEKFKELRKTMSQPEKKELEHYLKNFLRQSL